MDAQERPNGPETWILGEQVPTKNGDRCSNASVSVNALEPERCWKNHGRKPAVSGLHSHNIRKFTLTPLFWLEPDPTKRRVSPINVPDPTIYDVHVPLLFTCTPITRFHIPSRTHAPHQILATAPRSSKLKWYTWMTSLGGWSGVPTPTTMVITRGVWFSFKT